MATITIYGIKNCDTMKKVQRPGKLPPDGLFARAQIPSSGMQMFMVCAYLHLGTGLF